MKLTSIQRTRLVALLNGPSYLADETGRGRDAARLWWVAYKSLERKGLVRHPIGRDGYAMSLAYELTDKGRVEVSS